MKKILSTERDGKLLELYDRDEGSPEIFCEGIHGIASAGSYVKFNLFSTDPWEGDDPVQKRHIVARIVMPVGEFISTADLFKQIADQIRQSIAVETDSRTEQHEISALKSVEGGEEGEQVLPVVAQPDGDSNGS